MSWWRWSCRSMTRSEVTYLTVDKGWVTEASVEDVKLLPGVRRTMFRLHGGDWVARGVVKDVQSGRAKFILNTGDLVWWGKQGSKPSENPYWKLVNEDVLKQLPAPDDQMRAAGLPGRVFPAVGNHEVWDDSDVEGLLSAFPYLKQFGVSDKQLIYKFDYDGVRFIFLWTGPYDYREPTAWTATRPTYEEQMKQLKQWLDEAKAAGTKKVFIAFHNPAFCRSGMGAIPDAQNPHKTIASYAKDLDIVVFNGHVHTTELYEVDGVKYLLLGGGGAEQDPILPGRTHIKVPEGYPPDLYWKGASPKRNTTTCSWTSSPDRRRSLRSIASGRGRLNLSRPSSCFQMRGAVLPLPGFVLHPLTAVVIAAVHVYLATGHLSELSGGNVQWTHFWKGSSAR